jgi:hypothetical protein
MSDLIKFGSVALDRADAGEPAAFHAETTGGKITFRDDSWATVRCPGGRADVRTAPGTGHRPGPIRPRLALAVPYRQTRLVVAARRLRPD